MSLKTALIFCTFLFFVGRSFAETHVQCPNNLGCPLNYTCSANGLYCCEGANCTRRASWSNLSPICPHTTRGACRLNQFCLKEPARCVSNEIAYCDNYWKLESFAECGDNEYLIKVGFPMCADVFMSSVTFGPELAIPQCAESCVQHLLANYLKFGDDHTCMQLKDLAYSNLTSCYASCGLCFEPALIPQVLRLFEKYEVPQINVINFIAKCYWRFQAARNANYSLSTVVKEFVKEMNQIMSHDISGHFGGFDETKAELSSLENFDADSISIDQSDGISPMYFFLVIFVILLFNVAALYAIFRFVSRRYIYLGETNDNFQMRSLLGENF